MRVCLGGLRIRTLEAGPIDDSREFVYVRLSRLIFDLYGGVKLGSWDRLGRNIGVRYHSEPSQKRELVTLAR